MGVCSGWPCHIGGAPDERTRRFADSAATERRYYVHMLGYLIALLLAAMVGGVLLAQLGRARPPPRESTPVGPDRPSADEPTPARSVTATAGEKEMAARKTPPA